MAIRHLNRAVKQYNIAMAGYTREVYEASTYKHGTSHSFLASATRKLRQAEEAVLNAFTNPQVN